MNSSLLQERLRDVLAKNIEIKAFEVDQQFSEIGRRRLVINARSIASTQTVLIAIEDATPRKQALEELEKRIGPAGFARLRFAGGYRRETRRRR